MSDEWWDSEADFYQREGRRGFGGDTTAAPDVEEDLAPNLPLPPPPPIPEAAEVDVRRNSVMMNAAWDNVQERTVGTPHTVKTPRPTRPDFLRRVSSKGPPTMHVDLLNMVTQLETRLTIIGSNNEDETVDDILSKISEQVLRLREAISEAETKRDDRNHVDYLIDWKSLPCDVDTSENAQAFRRSAARFPHDRHQYNDWHIPQYFSTRPLPEMKGHVTAVVGLPAGEGEDVLKETRVVVLANDTPSEVLRKVFANVQKRSRKGDFAFAAEHEYVLKAEGFADFMLGESRVLLDYEYIRDRLRERQPIRLVLVRKPPVQQPVADEKGAHLAELYERKASQCEGKAVEPEQFHGMSVRNMAWDEVKALPMHELAIPFRVRIVGVQNASQVGLPRLDPSMTSLYVKMFLFHGMKILPRTLRQTRTRPMAANPRFHQWLDKTTTATTEAARAQDILTNEIPREARVVFMVFGKVYGRTDMLLGYVVVQLVDVFGQLRQGRMKLALWGMDIKEKENNLCFVFRSTTQANDFHPDPTCLHVQFDNYIFPVVAALKHIPKSSNLLAAGPVRKPLKSEKLPDALKALMNKDLLYKHTEMEKQLLWTHRDRIVLYPQLLPRFLSSLDWTNTQHRSEAHRLLQSWAPPRNPRDALQLLGARFADYEVRSYAVGALKTLPNDQLQLYLLQLIQCLKFEPYHDSPLTRFLITRALQSPLQIGHFLFWHLRAEMEELYFSERYALILEEYLSHCGRFARQLRRQYEMVHHLRRLAKRVFALKKSGKADEECMALYQMELEKLNGRFFSKGTLQIPLNPKIEVTTLCIDRCRYMSSKKIPLWLVFKNADQQASEDNKLVFIMFKMGDDLRQDILSLQLLKIMDDLWLGKGLDLRLKPYRTLATGTMAGMIEVVMKSDTTSGIQMRFGGGAMGALRLEPLNDYIKEHNPTKQQQDEACENFLRSCAGYCVATFVLGIGDRHNGNIMVTQDGHLFHIDFGHFLGNFKKKLGFNRERAAFVFTPEMAYVIGGKKYKKSERMKEFKALCCEAFNQIREHATLLENMFVLMVAAGIPELTKVEDVHYLRDKLCLDLSNQAASKTFVKEIKKSMGTVWRRIDNMIHNVKHK